ncbi:NADH-quinone oxidoreductase subunit C [Rubritalea marina]|uniref:NADH-quinone oxidoreductase subunit C n=1 Tax=Rubritalea marina TaxID=361055 RepID=UPI000376AAC6|nr:NADH-quinone oxidoreductase subunit C [Rubritalea marina]
MSSMIDAIQNMFGDAVLGSQIFRGEDTISVSLERAHELLAYCHGELGFNFLVDVCSIDHESSDPRFEMVYELASIDDSQHLRVKVPVAEDQSVQSVIDIWRTADWHEREVYDMMGIKFDGHPNLKRILMWEGYPFHPLRKEFPLAGKPSEMPDVAFTGVAPMEGGPFVTCSTATDTVSGEPRAKGES